MLTIPRQIRPRIPGQQGFVQGVQLLHHGGGDGRQGEGLPQLRAQGPGYVPQLLGEVPPIIVHVYTDAHHHVAEPSLRRKGAFRQDAAKLFAVQQQVVDPLDLGLGAHGSLQGTAHGLRREARQRQQRFRGQRRPEQGG